MSKKDISFLLIVLSLVLTSCKNFNTQEKGKVIARVGDSYLYEGDVARLINDGISVSDSTLLIDGYINRWARKKIILRKAELNLSEEETNFNRLIEEYRVDLITSAYRQKLLNQYLDTLVTNANIKEFYDSNKSNFLLNNDLLMLKYVVFPSNISEKRKIIKLIKSDDLEDFSKLEALCFQFSDDFSISDSLWMPINEVKREKSQLENIKNYKLLKKDSFFKKKDSLNLYLTRILDVRKKREIAPLSFVSERIHNIILNKRKLKLISSMEDQLVDDAIKNREFETFK